MNAPVALDPECLAMVRREIDRLGSITAVARAINYARPSLSLAMAGRYTGRLDAMEAAIRETFAAQVSCPHLVLEIPAEDCRSHRERPIPTADRSALKHWQACRICPLNPNRHA